MALITCKHLDLGYENTRVVEDLSFTVEQGDYLCIVGENGSGKSTLMKTLLGLRSPLSGQIVFGDGLHKNEIGYLPQQTPIQRDFPASVQEVVLSGCLARCGLRPFYSKEEKALAARNMERLGDEPVAGLDPKVTAELYDLIAELNRADGITVIMISHDIAAAVRYASHILHIGEGQRLFFGTAAAYRTSPVGQMFVPCTLEDGAKGGDNA